MALEAVGYQATARAVFYQNALKRWWLLIGVALVLTAAVWMTGDVRFRTMPDANQPFSIDMASLQSLWTANDDDQAIDITPAALTLKSEEPGRIRVRATIPLKHILGINKDGNTSQNTSPAKITLLVTGTVQRLSNPQAVLVAAQHAGFHAKSLKAGAVEFYGPAARLEGHKKTVEVAGLMRVAPEADTLELGFQSSGIGKWRLANLHVERVVVNPQYRSIRNVLGAAIVLCGLFFIWQFALRISWLNLASLAVLVVATIVLSSISKSDIIEVLALLRNLLGGLFTLHPALKDLPMQKAGHFVAYFALSLYLLACHRAVRMHTVQVAALVLVVSVFTESVQRHVHGRNANVMDIGINMSGFVLALFVYFTGVFVVQKFIDKRTLQRG